MSLSKRELQQKIAGAKHVRKMAFIGLAVSVAVFLSGLLLPFTLLFIVGYTVFIVCTGIISFVTILNWQYSKALKAQVKKKAPAASVCPRCGTAVDKNEKYCPKCGKKITAKKH
jgi:ribosomal protein L32